MKLESFSAKAARLAALALVVISVTPTSASLIAYEGFEYTAGTTVGGQSGGTGWTNAWLGTSAATFMGTNTALGLTYTDANNNALQTFGGSVIVGNPAGTTTTTATPNRLLPCNLSGGAGVVAGPGATTWISFLYKRLNFDLGTLPYSRQTTFSLFEGSGERVPIGSPNTTATVSNVFSVWGTGTNNGGAPFQSAAHPITPGSTYFVLMKIVTDSSAAVDTAYIWVNWTNLTIEPSNGTATFVQNQVNLSSVNTLRLQANNRNDTTGSNAVFQADELRVGTTFADVTPQAAAPATQPAITSQPANLNVVVGDPATFTVNADGTAPLRYQWYFNTNTVLANATNASLTLLNVQSNNAGAYSVIITNAAGSTNSAFATLTVLPPVAPGISSQPQNFTNMVGFNANFTVTATGTAPLRYQWYFNTTTPLSGRTNATLNFAIASTNDAGNFSVIVTNSAGSITSSVASLVVVPASPVGLPAFPGADGAAKFITGGRGGLVYHVTKLDRNMDHNEAGTLRYGLTDGNFPPGVPRTIVFDVAGTFWLGRFGAESNHMHGWDAASRYNLSGNTTIAGQTAPGPVIIAGGVTKASSVNTIARNITFAPSYGMRSFEDPPTLPTPGDFPDSFVFDALDISGQNILLDHLTTIYATDETISANELAANLTIQYCTIAQGENYPQADAENPGVYGGHALGSLLQAGSSAKVSVLNNFYAHLKGRLPRVGSEIGTGALNDFRNNVFYNWLGTGGSGSGGQPSFNNFINNFHLAGDGGDDVSGTNIVNASGGTGIFSGSDSSLTRVYHSGNRKDTNKDADPNDSVVLANGDYGSSSFQATAYDINIGVTTSAQAALTNALRYSGAHWWDRDYDIALGNTGAINTVDERLAHEAITGTGKIIAWADDPFDTSPTEGLEWKGLLALRADTNTFAAPFNRPIGWDTDGDGLPNTWETAHGLNPNLPNNNSDFDNDGYTDLEEYLNELAAWPAPGVITFNNNTNSRYASIFNWGVFGVTVNIAGFNTITYSLWQPSRFDTAVIHANTVVVDSVGQHAGYLRVEGGGILNITNGWLDVATKFEIHGSSTATISTAGSLVASNILNNGTLRLTGNAGLSVAGTFTNTGTLDIMTWSGALPVGLVNTGTILDRSLIVMTSFGLSGTSFTATIQGYAGHNYQLQYRDDLTSGSWQNVGSPVAGAGAPINFLHSGGGVGGQKFYRVAVNP